MSTSIVKRTVDINHRWIIFIIFFFCLPALPRSWLVIYVIFGDNINFFFFCPVSTSMKLLSENKRIQIYIFLIPALSVRTVRITKTLNNISNFTESGTPIQNRWNLLISVYLFKLKDKSYFTYQSPLSSLII